jgi:hypothetical protein
MLINSLEAYKNSHDDPIKLSEISLLLLNHEFGIRLPEVTPRIPDGFWGAPLGFRKRFAGVITRISDRASR